MSSPSGVAGREGVPKRSVSEGIGVGDAHFASLIEYHSEMAEALSSESLVISRKLVSNLSAQLSQLLLDRLGWNLDNMGEMHQ